MGHFEYNCKEKSNTEYASEYEEWVQQGNEKAEEILKNTVAG